MKHECSDTILIIGAGIAGLAAGCYAQMNGYKTQIFEMHDRPGGLCTAWQRQGFVFDGCIHYLFGIKIDNFNNSGSIIFPSRNPHNRSLK